MTFNSVSTYSTLLTSCASLEKECGSLEKEMIRNPTSKIFWLSWKIKEGIVLENKGSVYWNQWIPVGNTVEKSNKHPIIYYSKEQQESLFSLSLALVSYITLLASSLVLCKLHPSQHIHTHIHAKIRIQISKLTLSLSLWRNWKLKVLKEKWGKQK